jgi:hypothetical protein
MEPEDGGLMGFRGLGVRFNARTTSRLRHGPPSPPSPPPPPPPPGLQGAIPFTRAHSPPRFVFSQPFTSPFPSLPSSSSPSNSVGGRLNRLNCGLYQRCSPSCLRLILTSLSTVLQKTIPFSILARSQTPAYTCLTPITSSPCRPPPPRRLGRRLSRPTSSSFPRRQHPGRQ